MKEARLLHFWRNDKATPPTAFQLSNPGSKGMPVDIPLQQTFTEAKVLTESYETGLLEAITAVVGEGGIMDGWFVNPPPSPSPSDYYSHDALQAAIV